MSKEKDLEVGKGKQILVGGVIIGTIMIVVCGLLVGWRLIPGWVGEAFGTVAGILSTPFFMEGSFVVIGLITVLVLNTWRRRREGDEFVEIDTGEKSGSENSNLR